MWSNLSASQRSLWISYQKSPRLRGGYNIAFCPRILADVDPAIVHHTLKLMMSRHPMLAWQNAAGETLQLGDLQGRLFTSDQVTAQFDLSLTLGESDDRIEGGIEYASSLFDRETVERYVDHWQVLLRAMMQSADQPIARLPLLSDAERQKLLHGFIWSPGR